MFQCGIVVKTASVIDFVLRRSYEDMVVPFVAEIPDVADGDIHKLVLAALNKGGKAIMVSSNVDKLPMICLAHSLQIVYVFGLKGLVIIAGVAPGRKFVVQILLEFSYLCHSFNSPLR